MSIKEQTGSRFVVDLGNVKLPPLVERQVEAEIQAIVLREIAENQLDNNASTQRKPTIWETFPDQTRGLWPTYPDNPPAISGAAGGSGDISLLQNIPNPFNSTTAIHYTLPQTYSSAQIKIADKSGRVLKQLNLSGKGAGVLTIEAQMLSSGAYSYTLYVDGKMIGSKQMVLAK